MDMEFSPEDLAFQQEVRDFIAENYPAELREKQDEGEETQRFIWSEETAWADCIRLMPFGLAMVDR